MFVLVLLMGLEALGQDNNEQEEEEDLLRFSVSVGRFLPSRIAGISEIIPSVAIRAAINRKTYFFETSLEGGNAHSVHFHTLAFRVRSFMDSITPGAFWVFGLQNMYYQRKNVPFEGVIINDATTQSWGGWHYGFGYLSNKSKLSPRIDFVLAQKPGVALYISIGFEF